MKAHLRLPKTPEPLARNEIRQGFLQGRIQFRSLLLRRYKSFWVQIVAVLCLFLDARE